MYGSTRLCEGGGNKLPALARSDRRTCSATRSFLLLLIHAVARTAAEQQAGSRRYGMQQTVAPSSNPLRPLNFSLALRQVRIALSSRTGRWSDRTKRRSQMLRLLRRPVLRSEPFQSSSPSDVASAPHRLGTGACAVSRAVRGRSEPTPLVRRLHRSVPIETDSLGGSAGGCRSWRWC